MSMKAFLLSHLPAGWRWVRRACGGHWEQRLRSVPILGPVQKTYVWWEQFEECQYRTWPPARECEDYGPVVVRRLGSP
jgi:hypothetical protein